MAALPDISVLVPLIYDGHDHHDAAIAWMDTVQRSGDIVLCRVSQLGLLRLLNNPAVMDTDVQNGIEVWETWDALIADERFRFAEEPRDFDARFRNLTTSLAHQPRRWQDAYLAAFALAADLCLVSFDAGFRSFPGLSHRVLAPEISTD